MQRRQIIEHAVRKENGVIKQVGKCSPCYTPKVNYSGKGMQWYNDSKLIRKRK